MNDRLDIMILGLNYAPEPTGVACYTTGIARGLAAEGHRVQVVTGFPHYPAWRTTPGYEHDFRRRESDGDVEVLRVRHPVPRNTIGPGRVLMEAVFALQACVGGMRRPDLLLVMSPALLTVAAALFRRRGRPVAVGAIAQDLYSRAFPETGAMGGRGGALVTRLERCLFGRCDGLAVLHDTFRRTVVELGVPAERVTVIRNWAHIAPSTADPRRTRRELGWGEDETVVLHAGNIGHKQGLENVVGAARLADRAGAPVRFVLMGDGNRRAALEEVSAGIARLEFVDPLPDGRFSDALAAADVLLLNEKPEIMDMSVPGKLTSYFAAGRPVVAVTDPRSGAAAEVTASGAGTLVPSADPPLLLKSVLSLRDDPEQCATLGRHGQEYAEAVLSPAAALAAYSAWAQELVRARRVPRPRRPQVDDLPVQDVQEEGGVSR